MRVKQAKLNEYVPFKGSDGETSSEVEQPKDEFEDGSQSMVDDAQSSINDDDLMNADEFSYQLRQGKKTLARSARNLRAFLQGMQLYVLAKGIKVSVFAPSRLIIKNREIKPNFCFEVDNFNIFLNLINDYQSEQLVVKINTTL